MAIYQPFQSCRDDKNYDRPKHHPVVPKPDSTTPTDLQTKLARIETVIHLAEEWSQDQVMAESQIAIAALKDIRRIVREK